METSEIVALSIVALAVFLAARYFIGKTGGGGCGSGCPSSGRKKFKKR